MRVSGPPPLTPAAVVTRPALGETPQTRYASARNGHHLTDTDLERSHLGMVTDEAELAAREEHLLVWPACVDRALANDEYVDAIRAAATFFER